MEFPQCVWRLVVMEVKRRGCNSGCSWVLRADRKGCIRLFTLSAMVLANDPREARNMLTAGKRIVTSTNNTQKCEFSRLINVKIIDVESNKIFCFIKNHPCLDMTLNALIKPSIKRAWTKRPGNELKLP